MENRERETGQESESAWDSLDTENDMLVSETDASRSENYEKILDRAKLYREFGRIGVLLTNYDELVKTPKGEVKPTDVEISVSPEVEKTFEESEADALIKQIESALSDVDRSLENQLDYSIVNHKQINTRDALEHELQSGSGIPELDIRFDVDGKPWISHSTVAGKMEGEKKFVHESSSEEITEMGERLSLEDGLEILKKYKEDNEKHRVVLELKELGPTAETRKEYLETIKTMLEEKGLTESAIFATLSPTILKATHDAFPENSKFLNGGICPVVSFRIAEKRVLPDKKAWGVLGNVIEFCFSNSDTYEERPDGYGKQTGYLWAHLPKETVGILKQLNEEGKMGSASLTMVNLFAVAVGSVCPPLAAAIRTRYAEKLKKLGVRAQAGISKINPIKSIKNTKKYFGDDSIIYADGSPGEWAAKLPKIGE